MTEHRMAITANAHGFSIPGTPEHVKDARDQLAGFLTRAGLPGVLVEDAVLAGCELITNAVLHSASGLAGGNVIVHVTIGDYGWVQVDVIDQGLIPATGVRSPHQRISRGAEGGLGRFIVAGLSGELGDYTADDGQHVAWFRITWPAERRGEVVGSHD
jgi:anti-sigma regulatory factor (Ser/Thr protein kinase)